MKLYLYSRQNGAGNRVGSIGVVYRLSHVLLGHYGVGYMERRIIGKLGKHQSYSFLQFFPVLHGNNVFNFPFVALIAYVDDRLVIGHYAV